MNIFTELNRIKDKSLVLDSREVQTGGGYIAIRGTSIHGSKYISQSILLGAKLILTDVRQKPEVMRRAKENNCSIIYHADLLQKYPLYNMYHYRSINSPFSYPKIIAVTGTNGKTSIVELIKQQLDSCASIGTISQDMTTPNNCELHRRLSQYKDKTYVSLEVSSHALSQNRINGVELDTVIFSNLSRDHLDYHQTMQNYGKSKKLLFSEYPSSHAIVSVKDRYSYDIATQAIATKVTVIATQQNAIKSSSLFNQLTIQKIDCHTAGITIDYESTLSGQNHIEVPLYGKYNAFNMAAVIALLEKNNKSLQKKVKPVPGRMNIIKIDKNKYVCIDYAHSSDSLEKVLQSLKLHGWHHIVCIFGCGGDRDTGKRPIMGEIAAKFSKTVILTNDNPRTEDPKKIISQIASGINSKLHYANVIIEVDRRQAIVKGLNVLPLNGILLIAGKGHEDYQEIGEEKIPFSDISVIEENCL